LDADQGQVRLVKYAANRVLLGIFYFWLGCYVVDIADFNFWQVLLARLTGVLAWVVAVGNVLLACVRTQPSDVGEALPKPSAPTAAAVAEPDVAPPCPGGAEEPDVEHGAGPATAKAPAAATPMPVGGWNEAWSHKEGNKVSKDGTGPPGGWNTSWTEAFGGR